MMEKQLKLIWDFYGPDAQRTAAHHALHLREYIKIHQLNHNICELEKQEEMHWTVYIVVDEIEMKKVRDALLPHRGAWY